MKNYSYITLAILGLVITTMSCKRTLEMVPLENLTENYVFDPTDSAGVNANGILMDVYDYMPNGFNRVSGDFLDAAAGDAISSSAEKSAVELMQTGGLTPFFNPDDAFTNNNLKRQCYIGIRKATVFINNIDIVPVTSKLPNGKSVRASWKAEARFLRALLYFELVKRYGGIPLLGDKTYVLGDNLELPRNSFAECVKYIVDQCDLAYPDLRPDPVDDNNYGRVTQAGALALKSRMLLYAASKLYNGGNIDAANNLTGYTDYDKNRWKLAADAADAVMKLNVFLLDDSLKTLFVHLRSKEIILANNGGDNGRFSTTVENINGPIGVGDNSGQGRTSPTQELVDAFGTINGKPISEDVKSSTNPTGYDANNPYSSRDPRLDLTVLHNGSLWLKSILQTYDGGRSKPGGAQQQTVTGYYLRKFMGDFTNANNYSTNQYHNFIIFRYAEILLNFAEATNEFTGPTNDVYNALTQIRKRAGIAPGANNLYGLKAGMNHDEMQQAIYNERHVEMAFEEQRFWDIRRWKIAGEVYNKPLHGIHIVRDQYTGIFTSSIDPVLITIFFDPKMYLYPIPYSEVVKNRNMKQNPGW